MAVSAHDATILVGNYRGDQGVAMQEVQQYSLNVNAAGVGFYSGVQYRRDMAVDLGTVRLVAFANNVFTNASYGRRYFLDISHDEVSVFKAWVRLKTLNVEAVAGDVIRYTIDLQIIWLDYQ